MRTVVHTLGFNTLEANVNTIRRTREMNTRKRFEYIVADLGFPLAEFDEQPPVNIDQNKQLNSDGIRDFAKACEVEYVQLPNIGVSQNWEAIRQHKKVGKEDVLICADPDEKAINENWIHAIADVLQADRNMAWVSLHMPDYDILMERWGADHYTEKRIGGHHVIVFHSLALWAQGGFSGEFLEEIGGVPWQKLAPVYGFLESAAYERFGTRWKWCALRDFHVEHQPSPPLYGQYKQYVASSKVITANQQTTFETWLREKKY